MFNLNDTTPAAPAGKVNVKWQSDASGNTSGYVSTGGATIEINGSPTTDQTVLNFIPGTNIGITNPSGGQVQIAFTGQLAQTIAQVAHKWLDSYSATTGLFTQSQPAYTDLSGLPQLPQTFSPVSHQFLTGYNATTGLFSAAQPAFADLSGNIAVSQMNSGTGASSSTFWRGDGTWATAGGSGIPSRSTVVLSTVGTAAGTVVTGSAAIFKTFKLLQLACSFPTRVRLYSTQAARDADTGTSNGVAPDRASFNQPDPTQPNGIICDFYLDGTKTFAGNLTAVTGNGTTATYTVTDAIASALATGVSVTISGFINSGFNGVFTVSGTTGSPVTSFTVANSTNASETVGSTYKALLYAPNYLLWNCSPNLSGNNDDATVSTTIYYALTNLDSVSRNLAVTLTVLQQEA